jgi:hypothetical protein
MVASNYVGKGRPSNGPKGEKHMTLYEFDCWRCIRRAENMVIEAKRRHYKVKEKNE